jgi:hypothetical protein
MKRAREQNVEAAGQQGGETAVCVVLPAHRHDDDTTTTASPNRKKPRLGGRVDDDDKEGGLEWNLLRDLPYVAFRRLLDFLSSATANAGTAPFLYLLGSIYLRFVYMFMCLFVYLFICLFRGLVEGSFAWGAGAVPRARREWTVRW